MINPIRAILNYLAWRRRDRQETVIAMAVFTTNIVDAKGADLGVKKSHVVSFCVDGNKVRYSRVATTHREHMKGHSALLQARERWRVLGTLPEHAERPNAPRKAELIVFPGGAA